MICKFIFQKWNNLIIFGVKLNRI